jgi:hypothetical protein
MVSLFDFSGAQGRTGQFLEQLSNMPNYKHFFRKITLEPMAADLLVYLPRT